MHDEPHPLSHQRGEGVGERARGGDTTLALPHARAEEIELPVELARTHDPGMLRKSGASFQGANG